VTQAEKILFSNGKGAITHRLLVFDPIKEGNDLQYGKSRPGDRLEI
jgi:hypothetical protein